MRTCHIRINPLLDNTLRFASLFPQSPHSRSLCFRNCAALPLCAAPGVRHRAASHVHQRLNWGPLECHLWQCYGAHYLR